VAGSVQKLVERAGSRTKLISQLTATPIQPTTAALNGANVAQLCRDICSMITGSVWINMAPNEYLGSIPHFFRVEEEFWKAMYREIQRREAHNAFQTAWNSATERKESKRM
jgi:hypothetical protein